MNLSPPKFAPQLPPFMRPPHREMLGKFVPTALRREPAVARLKHPIKLALLGFITAGLLPLRMLQRRVRKVQLMYSHQAELAGELLVLHGSAEDQKLLDDSAKGVRASWWALRGSELLLAAAIAVGIAFVLPGNHVHQISTLWLSPLKYHERLPQVFIGLIAASYLLLIVQINLQIARMQQLAIAVNGSFESLPPIAPPPLVFIGRSPLTLLLGLTLAWIGLAWALPMAVAWSAFSHFIRSSAYTFRVDLAERLQSISGVTPVIDTRDLCPNPHCRNAIPEGAIFCPRCGTVVVEGAAA